MRKSSSSGSAVTKAIIIQVVIVVCLAAWFGLVFPLLRRSGAASQAAKREVRIEELFHSMVIDDPRRAVQTPDATGESQTYAQRLRMFPSMDEVKQTVGAPDSFSGDFRGGVHLIWTGTAHRLEASFNHGRLYCLRREDLHTGHGELVFESSENWQAF